MDGEPIVRLLIHARLILRLLEELGIGLTRVVHAVLWTVEFLLCQFPAAQVVVAQALAAEFHITLVANHLADSLLRVVHVDILIGGRSRSVSSDAGARTDTVHILQYLRIARVALIQRLRVVQVGFPQAVEHARAILEVTILHMGLRVYLLAQQVAVLRCIVGMDVVIAPVEEVEATLLLREVGVVERHRHIEPRLAVAITLMRMLVGDCTAVDLLIPCRGVARDTALLEALCLVTRRRVGDGQTVLHEESVHQLLRNAIAARTARVSRRYMLLILRVVATARAGKQDFLIALVEGGEEHVLHRHVVVHSARLIGLLIQRIARCLRCLYQQLAGIRRLAPTLGVVLLREDLFAFVVHIARIIAVAIH